LAGDLNRTNHLMTTTEQKLFDALYRICKNAHRKERHGFTDDIVAPLFLNEARALLEEIEASNQRFRCGMNPGETCCIVSQHPGLSPIFDYENGVGIFYCFALSPTEAKEIAKKLNKSE